MRSSLWVSDCTANLRVSDGVSYIAVLNPSMLVWLDLQGEQMMHTFTFITTC